jgi:integrase
MDYVQLRGKVYWFNRKVPKGLVPAVGATHWRLSLNTKDEATANVRARVEAVKTDKIIEAATNPFNVAERTVISAAGGIAKLRADVTALQKELHFAQVAVDMLSTQDAPRIRTPDGVLESPDDSLAHLDTLDDVRQLAALVGGRFAERSGIVKKAVTDKPPTPKSLLAALEPYAVSDARLYAARRFSEAFPGLKLTEVTRAHAAGFVKMLEQMAARAGDRSIQRAINTPGPRIARATVRQVLFKVRAMLNEAANAGDIQDNPWATFKFNRQLQVKHAPSVVERGFTPEELRLIDQQTMREEDRWWFYLLAYHGLRTEEGAQLRAVDVFQKDGVWSLRVTDEGDEMSVKTRQSVRTLPLHADLIAIGFLTYVAGRSGALFPSFKGERKGMLVARRFAGICNSLGIKKSAHGLRHAWKTAARRAGLRDDVSEHLAGRKATGNVGDAYGTFSDLSTAMNSVKPFDDPA